MHLQIVWLHHDTTSPVLALATAWTRAPPASHRARLQVQVRSLQGIACMHASSSRRNDVT